MARNHARTVTKLINKQAVISQKRHAVRCKVTGKRRFSLPGISQKSQRTTAAIDGAAVQHQPPLLRQRHRHDLIQKQMLNCGNGGVGRRHAGYCRRRPIDREVSQPRKTEQKPVSAAVMHEPERAIRQLRFFERRVQNSSLSTRLQHFQLRRNSQRVGAQH